MYLKRKLNGLVMHKFAFWVFYASVCTILECTDYVTDLGSSVALEVVCTTIEFVSFIIISVPVVVCWVIFHFLHICIDVV